MVAGVSCGVGGEDYVSEGGDSWGPGIARVQFTKGSAIVVN